MRRGEAKEGGRFEARVHAASWPRSMSRNLADWSLARCKRPAHGTACYEGAAGVNAQPGLPDGHAGVVVVLSWNARLRFLLGLLC